LAAHTDSNYYEATPARPFLRLLKSLPLDSLSNYTFIDLGCGKGLALVLAAKDGFKRVVGLELDPQLLESARINVHSFRKRVCTSSSVELIRADAVRYKFPPEPTVVFLFNPFGEQTMREVARNIQQSLEEERRPLIVAYINPLHEHVFDEIPWREMGCLRGRPMIVLAKFYGSDLPTLHRDELFEPMSRVSNEAKKRRCTPVKNRSSQAAP
jgi:SAM-dependent methyltransferase